MPGVIPNYKEGPTSWPVLGYNGVGTPTVITGGQLVMPNTGTAAGTMVLPTTALALTCLGVAAFDAAAPRSSQDNQNPAVISQQPDIVSVYYGVDIDVTYSANCACGELVVAGAAGVVTPYTTGTSLEDQIVGRCTQPGGVVVGTTPVGSCRLRAM